MDNPYTSNIELNDPAYRFTQREIYNAIKDQQKKDYQNDQYKQDLSRGQELYNQWMGSDAFQNMWDARSEGQKEILDRRRDLSRGLSAQENAAARGQFESAIRRSGAAARNNLNANLAGRGMSSGGYAASQRGALESELAQQAIGAERQLLLDNVNARNQGLTAYENTLNQQEGLNRDNLYNQLALAMGLGQQGQDLAAALRNERLEKYKAEQANRGGLLSGLF